MEVKTDFLTAVNSLDSYQKLIEPFQTIVKQKDHERASMILSEINRILLKPKDHKPIAVLNSLRFLQETIHKSDLEYCQLFIVNLKDTFIEMGKYLQGDREMISTLGYLDLKDKIVQNSIIVLIKECVMVWAHQMENTQYQSIYYDWKAFGVLFSRNLNYFNILGVYQSLQNRKRKISEESLLSVYRNNHLSHCEEFSFNNSFSKISRGNMLNIADLDNRSDQVIQNSLHNDERQSLKNICLEIPQFNMKKNQNGNNFEENDVKKTDFSKLSQLKNAISEIKLKIQSEETDLNRVRQQRDFFKLKYEDAQKQLEQIKNET